MSKQQLHRIVVILLMLVSLSAFLPLSASAQGNNEAAQACQKGGWRELRGPGGRVFANQGECVSYAAQGGSFHFPYVVVQYNPNDSSLCGYRVDAYDFPLGNYYVEVTGTDKFFRYTMNFFADPQHIVGEYWQEDGKEYTVSSSVYSEEGGKLLASDTITFRCDEP